MSRKAKRMSSGRAKVWVFDCEESVAGPITLSARVIADSKPAAIRRLARWIRGRRMVVSFGRGGRVPIECIGIRFNANALSQTNLREMKGEVDG